MSRWQWRRQEDLPLGARLLGPKTWGKDVAALQKILMTLGYFVTVDGVYGYATEVAVRHFQARMGLSVDGLVGPATLAALGEVLRGDRYVLRYVRPGETMARLAVLLGVTEEALRRHNGMRPYEPVNPGRLLTVPRRAILLMPGEKAPLTLRYTLRLGPVLDPSRPETVKKIEEEFSSPPLPLLRGGMAEWSRLPEAWPWLFPPREEGIRALAVELPPAAWSEASPPSFRFFLRLGERAGCPLCLFIPLEVKKKKLLRFLADLPAYIFLDPGTVVFHLRPLVKAIRRWLDFLPAERLLLVLRGGACRRTPEGEEEILSLRPARGRLLAARLRPVWDEEEAVYRIKGKEEDTWYLLEAKGLHRRIRMVDRFGLAGVVLGGLGGIILPGGGGPWPGEFVVLDSFPPPTHID